MKYTGNILTIDTTTNILKVGVLFENEFYMIDVDKGFYHIENLLPTIDKLFNKNGVKKNDINYIGVCVGPGSFTGMRIGIATALGISFALDIPSFGFSVFDIYNFVYTPSDKSVFIPVIDAKKNRFYCSFITNSHKKIYDISASEIMGHIKKYYSNKQILFGGSGASLLSSQLHGDFNLQLSDIQDYSSRNILNYCNKLLSDGEELSQPQPIYIRKSEAEIALLKKKGLDI